jgi:hypothetical protein
MATLSEIVAEVDRRAVEYPIGQLQSLRKTIHGLSRMPAREVFGYARDEHWTFHIGGRDELQFNLGIEEPFPQGDDLRYGVAFSFETSRSLPSIEPLIPKVALFNEYLREFAEDFSGFWMWHYFGGERSDLRRPAPIDHELVRKGVFLFLGGIGDSAAPDYATILDTLSRFVPLYRFIESNTAGKQQPSFSEPPVRLGCPDRPTQTSGTLAERLLAIDLRHNALQAKLYNELVVEHGYSYVVVEHPAASGGKIDIAVIKRDRRLIFEIKTAVTPGGCIRQAVGQLLEYSCWPNSPIVHELVVVGEPTPDAETSAYLQRLNENFPVSISYRQVQISCRPCGKSD